MDSFNINRFGEVSSDVDHKIEHLKREFLGVAKNMFDTVEGNLVAHLRKSDELVKNIGVSDRYISLGGKRIVSVGKSIDKNDAVIKDELTELARDVSRAMKVVKFIVPKKASNDKDTLEIQQSRRISGVSQGVHPYDVVVKLQLDEVDARVNSVDSEFRQFRANVKESINTLYGRLPPNAK